MRQNNGGVGAIARRSFITLVGGIQSRNARKWDGRHILTAAKRGDHARTAFTDYLNRVPKRGAIETLHVDGERVKLKGDVVHQQPHARAASLGVFDVLATEVD